MRWIGRVSLALALAWLVYVVSPYFALYSLARAVEARDIAAVEKRVNLRAIRLSLGRQIVEAYLDAKGQRLDAGLRRQVTAGAGATIAEPLLAQLVTPKALIDLLDQGLPTEGAAADGGPLDGLSLDGFEDAWRVFRNSETRGFRIFQVSLPDERPPAERFTVQMRLIGGTWRVVGIELPESVRRRLVQELPADVG